MAFDVKTLALANLAVQILLVIMVLRAAYFAKKRELMRHCNFMKVLVPVQIIAIAAVMLPSMLGYIENPPGFYIEMLVHHTLGLLVIALWLYINLAFGKVIGMPRKSALFMRTAFILWILAFFLGLHMYALIYL